MSVIPSRRTQGLIVDLFAGGGGASIGIEAALGRDVDIAINHDPIAIAVHKANHPNTEHYATDIWDVKPKVACRGRPVKLLHASPDCKDFSRAKGGKPKSGKIRSLAWVVHRWANDVRPDVITLENVPEFVEWCQLDDEGKRIEKKKGETFRRWVRGLEKLGYVVEHRVLTASHYGAPTSRKRLFLIARCDGLPITWPTPTHGPGLLPFHTAAECIDWSIPNPSIFTRKKALAEKTLRRVAAGIVRYALSGSPFIVTIDNGSSKGKPQSINAPLGTIIATNPRHALVVPTLIQTSYGERKGQAPRVLDLHKPLGTIVAQGQKHALVCAFIAKHYGGVVGQALNKPIGTVTAVDHHSLVTAAIDVGDHAHEIRAFLIAYYGEGSGLTGHPLTQPLPTVVTQDRFGLVTVKLPDGSKRAISDITLRMLAPHELAGAQFGRFAAAYDMSQAKTTKDKVRLVGNSVCPELEEAIVAAQFPRLQRRAA